MPKMTNSTLQSKPTKTNRMATASKLSIYASNARAYPTAPLVLSEVGTSALRQKQTFPAAPISTTWPRAPSAWADRLQRGGNPFVQRGGWQLSAPDSQYFSVR